MFFPKKSKIFDYLQDQSVEIIRAAELFKVITEDPAQLEAKAREMKQVEDEADSLVHAVVVDLEKTFILPLDKEDVRELTEYLDDVVDIIEQTTNRLKIYRISKTNQSLKSFADFILKASQDVEQGILLIKDRKQKTEDFVNCYQNLHYLENKTDELHREVLEKLMNGLSADFGQDDFLLTIKWKEIFQTLEDLMDRYEKIAIIFERIRLKYI